MDGDKESDAVDVLATSLLKREGCSSRTTKLMFSLAPRHNVL